MNIVCGVDSNVSITFYTFRIFWTEPSSGSDTTVNKSVNVTDTYCTEEKLQTVSAKVYF